MLGGETKQRATPGLSNKKTEGSTVSRNLVMLSRSHQPDKAPDEQLAVMFKRLRPRIGRRRWILTPGR